MIKGIFLIVGGIIFALLVNTKMALSVIALLPFVLIMITIIGIMTSPLLKKTQRAVEDVAKVIGENVSGIRLIKTYNLEAQRVDKIIEINKR
ncbi:UNVERIFIED_CONTAM: ABC transporter transmembrane domain-containing protein [Campylobacter lari]